MLLRMKVIAPVVLMLISGCGGSSGPTLHNVSGTVTFDGQPVPYGRIEFEPDKSKGNEGGTGYADIVDGKFDTAQASGRGTIGGAHIIHVRGQKNAPPAAGPGGTIDENAPAVDPEILFSNYTEEHDLPTNGSTLEVQVPATAKFEPAKAGPVDRGP